MSDILSKFKKQKKEIIKNIYCITFSSGPSQLYNLMVIAFTLEEAISMSKSAAVQNLKAVENTLEFKTFSMIGGEEVLKNILDLEEINEKGLTKKDANKLMKELIKNKDKGAIEKANLSEAQKKYVLDKLE